MDDFGENFLDLQVEKELAEDPALLGYENSHNELLIEEDPSGLELEFQAASSDPAAEFLAREQQELGDWAGELGFENSFSNDQSGEEIRVVEDLFSEEIRVHSSPSPQLVLDHPKEQAEPEKIRQWRENYAKQLKEKDEKENTQKEELRNQAKRELSDWYSHYEDQLAKTRSSNRESEKDFLSSFATIVPGTEWERVSKMCDFSSKSNKSSRDLSRMKSVMLQLKQHPLTKNIL